MVELLAPRPTPKMEEHPLSPVRDCLFVQHILKTNRISFFSKILLPLILNFVSLPFLLFWDFHDLMFSYLDLPVGRFTLCQARIFSMTTFPFITLKRVHITVLGSNFSVFKAGMF
jgi:hypothetical protein